MCCLSILTLDSQTFLTTMSAEVAKVDTTVVLAGSCMIKPCSLNFMELRLLTGNTNCCVLD